MFCNPDAPITRSAFELFLCDEMCEGCPSLLSADHSIDCRSGEHAIGQWIAGFSLAVFGVIIPCMLLFFAHKSRRKRTAVLELREDIADTWFDEMNTNHDDILQVDEVQNLLERVYQEKPTQDAVKTAMSEMMGILDKESSARNHASPSKARDTEEFGITRDEYLAWSRMQAEAAVVSPFDSVYGYSQFHRWWWFAEILYVKMAINTIFLTGYYDGLDWQVYMHLVLGLSLMMLVNLEPYHLKVDQQVESFSLISLGIMTHLATTEQVSERPCKLFFGIISG